MISTVFFKTLQEAQAFQPRCVAKEVYSLDMPKTAKKFREWQDDAIAWERHEALDARAVVVIYR